MRVLCNGRCQVGEILVDVLAKGAACEETCFARGSLDGHATEYGFERVEFGGEVDDGIFSGQEAAAGRDHEGW